MTIQQKVFIKGTKDGLMFLFSDECSFDELLTELKEKLEHSHQNILSGPIMKVTLKMGKRKLTQFQEEQIREVFKIKGNLFIQEIENEAKEALLTKNHVKVVSGTVRSGQIYQFDESILFVGDVNPGGHLFSSGDIYVIGALRGIAHAGMNGDTDSIIAASIMEPTQLRIGNLVSQPPEKWQGSPTRQEYAYVKEDQIAIDQIQHFSKVENLLTAFK